MAPAALEEMTRYVVSDVTAVAFLWGFFEMRSYRNYTALSVTAHKLVFTTKECEVKCSTGSWFDHRGFFFKITEIYFIVMFDN